MVASPANGASIKLRVGGSAGLSLTEQWPWFWDRPTSDDQSVVRLTGEAGGFPVDCQYTGTLMALRPGTAHVQAVTDTPCLHVRPPCLPPQLLWRITITVT